MFRKDDTVRFYYSSGNLTAIWRLLGYYYFYAEIFSPDDHRTKRIGYLLDWKSSAGSVIFMPKNSSLVSAIPLNYYDSDRPIKYTLTTYQANLLNLLARSVKNGEEVQSKELDSIFPDLETDNLGDFYTQLLDLRI